MAGLVRYIHWNMKGAPRLSPVKGGFLKWFEQIAVHGFNEVTATATLSGNTATFNASGHGFLEHAVVAVSGAATAGWNGEYRVESVTDNTFTITVASGLDPLAGSCKVKVAPLGWSKVFSSGDTHAVYRPDSQTSTRYFYRIVDDGTTPGRGAQSTIQMYRQIKSATDTTSNEFATSIGHIKYAASQQDDAFESVWYVVSDGDAMYLMMDFRQSSSRRADGNTWSLSLLGDVVSVKPNDQGRAMIMLNSSNIDSYVYNELGSVNSNRSASTSSNAVTEFAMRQDLETEEDQVGAFGFQSRNFAYPNAADGGFYAFPILALDRFGIRGTFPGAYSCIQPSPFATGAIVSNISALPGRHFVLLRAMSSSERHPILVDITGPWR